MKHLVVAVLVACSFGPVAGAECVPPLDSDEVMLSVVRMEGDVTIRTLEVHSGGLARSIDSRGPDETWLEPGGAKELLQSLQSFGEVKTPRVPGSESPDSGRFRLTLNCFDVNRGEQLQTKLRVASGDLEQEVYAIDRWLYSRIQTENDQAIWVSGPSHPIICQPDHRRELGIAVEEPFWCEGQVGGLFGEDKHSTEQIREMLRERLERLPRGLQTEGADGSDG